MNRKRKVNPIKEGGIAFKRGAVRTQKGNFFVPSNPYPVNTKENRGWELGFNQAFFSNLAKVKKHEFRTRG